MSALLHDIVGRHGHDVDLAALFGDEKDNAAAQFLLELVAQVAETVHVDVFEGSGKELDALDLHNLVHDIAQRALRFLGLERLVLALNGLEFFLELLDVINEFDGTQLSNHRVTPPNVRRWSADTIVVYGSNADDTDGEKGFSNTHISRFNHYPLSGYPICTIGASMDVIKKDVEGLINKVLSQPQKTFVIENVGISKKTNLGVETMAPLFEPLTDVGNVYFVKEYWDYYQSR